MPIVETHKLKEGEYRPDSLQVYNGLDCCITFEVYEALQNLFNQEPEIYTWERALQAPILEIMLRGFKVDEYERRQGIEKLTTEINRLDHILQSYAQAVWSKPLNPRSHVQMKSFFYGAMRLPEHWISDKGQRKLSFKREVLEKLEIYFYAMPIIACILAMRDRLKQREILSTEVDPDGRLRTSYNIAGTETGRLSSSSNAFGTGGNLQNIPPELRRMFIADDGLKLCTIDLEQAEARELGYLMGVLFNDWTYLDNCESGDLHTANARLVWPGLSWTGDNREDRKIADRIFYREFSYRDMSKRGGHACLTPDHEVLTAKGWVPITSKPTEIMCWSERGSFLDKVTHWTEKEISGELHSFEGNSISLNMTADHRVPYRSDNHSCVLERPAEAGPGRFMPLGDGYWGGETVVPARLIAAFMADGHQKSANTMEFHFRKERKIKRLQVLCKQYNFVYQIKPQVTGTTKIVVDGALQKNLDWNMLEWSGNCIRDFLDEYKFWDGHSSATAVSISSVNLRNLQIMQTLGRICGIGGNIQKPQISGLGSVVYRLQQNNRKWATGSSVTWTKSTAQNQLVLCPTVSTGWFYVRRKGKICVTGNTNYYGQPFTIARHLKVPVELIKDFQSVYFAAFPCITQFHRWVAEQLQTIGSLTTQFGRQRHFYGRSNDDATLREAIAYMGQSPTADRTNLGLYRHWDYFKTKTQLLAQTHDSITFQYDPAYEAEIIPQALKLIEVDLFHQGRKFTIPGEAKVGWNWAAFVDEAAQAKAIAMGRKPPRLNPNGQIKFNPQKPDTRVRVSGLDRVL